VGTWATVGFSVYWRPANAGILQLTVDLGLQIRRGKPREMSFTRRTSNFSRASKPAVHCGCSRTVRPNISQKKNTYCLSKQKANADAQNSGRDKLKRAWKTKPSVAAQRPSYQRDKRDDSKCDRKPYRQGEPPRLENPDVACCQCHYENRGRQIDRSRLEHHFGNRARIVMTSNGRPTNRKEGADYRK
jgi:hypothetical protein